jgi:SAM-dependent methyltransferase
MADTCSPGEGTTLALEPHLIAPMHPGSPPAGKTVLNVGCGYPLRQRLHRHFHGPEWREIRLDLDPAVQPDIVCSITEMSPVAADSVDAIWSSHNLEHLQRHEVPLALAEFIRVLKPHGLLLLTLPDLRQVAQLVAEDRLEDQAYTSLSGPITPLDMIFGHTASLTRGNPFMAHRTGFTARTLHKVLIEAGFVEITLRQGRSFDLWATAYKPTRSGVTG